MKGKITKHGDFYLFRKNKYEEVFCRLAPTVGVPCSDSCALFGEPQLVCVSSHEGMLEKDQTRIKLSLCHKTYYFEEFIDERELHDAARKALKKAKEKGTPDGD